MPFRYYDKNSNNYFNQTCHYDMEGIYSIFLKSLNDGSYILDLGCGSGRDSLYFKKMGFNVKAVDGSKELAKLAKEHSGVDVICEEYSKLAFEKESFHGIWCCASLLHLNNNELLEIFKKIEFWLKPAGLVYASFKFGNQERIDGDRFFNDFDEIKINNFANKLEKIKLIKIWDSNENRNEQNLKWLNVLFQKF